LSKHMSLVKILKTALTSRLTAFDHNLSQHKHRQRPQLNNSCKRVLQAFKPWFSLLGH
jgi:hypothetical protein